MKIFGELFLIFLLLVTNGRIFFIKRAKQDSVVVLAPICLLLSILQFFSWGFEFTIIATFILALTVFFTNFHAMFRYSEKLYIDHYSPLMYFWSIVTTILSILLMAITIYFMPVEFQSQKIGISETKILFTGNFRSGFNQSKYTVNPNLTVYRFEKNPENVSKFQDDSEVTLDEETSEIEQPEIHNIVIFFPDKTADTFYYRPYLQHLTKEGFIVYSADFFADDCRWMHSIADFKALRRTVMSLEKALSPKKFSLQKEFYTYNISLECKALLEIVNNYEKENLDTTKKHLFNYYLLGDEMSTDALKDFYYASKSSFETKNPDEVLSGYYLLTSLESYKTPGFGCITQTDPLLATIIGIERNYSSDDIKQMVKETSALFGKNFIINGE